MKRWHGRPLLALAVLAIALLVVACGGGGGGGGAGGTPAPKPYAVSGQIHVKDAPDEGIEGVTVTFGGAAAPVTTNAEGLWARDGLTGTVTVTPEHDEYIFQPESQVVTKAATNVNFEAEPGFVAYGTITDDDDDPIQGVVVDFGGARASVMTDVDGKVEPLTSTVARVKSSPAVPSRRQK